MKKSESSWSKKFYPRLHRILKKKTMVAHLGRGQMTDEGKWKIIILMQEHGNPNAVAPRIPCDVRTMKKWWRVYQKHGTCFVPRNRSGKMGAPKKWDSSVKSFPKSTMATEDVCFASEICRPALLGKVPIRTINRILTAGVFHQEENTVTTVHGRAQGKESRILYSALKRWHQQNSLDRWVDL